MEVLGPFVGALLVVLGVLAFAVIVVVALNVHGIHRELRMISREMRTIREIMVTVVGRAVEKVESRG